jgi:hypothetical protein
MKIIELVKTEHSVKIGDDCPSIVPNIVEDTLFVSNGATVGFYLKNVGKYSKKALELSEIANREFLSNRVPKTVMNRSTGYHEGTNVKQFSTIIGSIQARPHMRRPYNSISAVHNKPSAKTFIKAMWLLALEAENVMKDVAPDVYAKQKEIFDRHVDKKWRFGNIFTSSISNFNIASGYHRDSGNIEGCANVIITRRDNSTGGNTTIPDYNATVDSADGSILVYPAWRNVHGVTPIIPTKAGGYRNSLVFYPLRAFVNKHEKTG